MKETKRHHQSDDSHSINMLGGGNTPQLFLRSVAAENTDEIIQILIKIETWIDDNWPSSSDFNTNDEFMEFAVDVMILCLELLKAGVDSAPDAETASKGHTKHKAIIVGHMVRITKLYEGALIHISRSQFELAAVFFRLIFETAIRVEYLIKSKSKRKSCRSFILSSYRSDRETLQDLNAEAKKGPLNQVGERIRRKIKSRLRNDRISQTELMSNTIWNVDGKNFRNMMKELGYERFYSYIFGGGSHHIHGDWYEISVYHLDREGRYYTPDLTFTDPDPRLTCSLTHICLRTLLTYLEWNKSDLDRVITPVVVKLFELNRAFDDIHEVSFGNDED